MNNATINDTSKLSLIRTKKVQGRIIKKKKKKKTKKKATTNQEYDLLSITLDSSCGDDSSSGNNQYTPPPTPSHIDNTSSSTTTTTTTIHIDAELSSELQRICFIGARISANVQIPDDNNNNKINNNNCNYNHDTKDEDVVVYRAMEIHLIRCAPDPTAVEFVLSAFGDYTSSGHPTEDTDEPILPTTTITNNTKPPSNPIIPNVVTYHKLHTTVIISTICLGPERMGGLLQVLQTMANTNTNKKGRRARRVEIAKLVRSLLYHNTNTNTSNTNISNGNDQRIGTIRTSNDTYTKKVARQRIPRMKQVDLNILDRLEDPSNQQGWSLLDSSSSSSTPLLPSPSSSSVLENVGNGEEHQGIGGDDNDDHDDDEYLLNIPGGDDDDNDKKSTQLSSRGSMTRADYHSKRKVPQVKWMVSRLKQMESNKQQQQQHVSTRANSNAEPSTTTTTTTFQNYRHILDVGCGRGDLAAAIASAFNNNTTTSTTTTTIVTVLDKNKQSLDAAREYSKRVGCFDSMNFIEADFLFSIQTNKNSNNKNNKDDDDVIPLFDPKLPPVDVVVALHACGDLTDLILEYARDRCIPFLICPCCYTKRLLADRGFVPRWYQLLCTNDTDTNDGGGDSGGGDDIAALQRLAESSVRSMSLRSMTIINSMRVHVQHDVLSNTLLSSSSPSSSSLSSCSKKRKNVQMDDSSSSVVSPTRMDNSYYPMSDTSTLLCHPTTTISLEHYSSAFSLRNMVLINEN